MLPHSHVDLSPEVLEYTDLWKVKLREEDAHQSSHGEVLPILGYDFPGAVALGLPVLCKEARCTVLAPQVGCWWSYSLVYLWWVLFGWFLRERQMFVSPQGTSP